MSIDVKGIEMGRKTVDVEYVKDRANTFLAHNDMTAYSGSKADSESLKEQRYGVIAMVESVLHATGNYKGFQYLSSETDSSGILKPDYDDTRRKYL